MSLQILITDVTQLASGVLYAELDPSAVAALGSVRARAGSRSVVLLTPNASPDPISKTLKFKHDDALVLSLGSSNQCLFLVEDVESPQSKETTAPKEGNSKHNLPFVGPLDREFMSTVPENMRPTASVLLENLRRNWTGRLVKRGRRWVSSPDNFWTITFQPRDMSFVVTVRGRPERFQDCAGGLKISGDRPGYSRFKVRALRDAEGAIAVIDRARMRGTARTPSSP